MGSGPDRADLEIARVRALDRVLRPRVPLLWGWLVVDAALKAQA